MSWLPKALARVRKLASAGKVLITYKALLEAAELGYDATDVVAVLCALETSDSAGRIRSSIAREWLYVWKPKMGGMVIYLKHAIRDDCIVVSFHEDEERNEGGR